MKVANVLKKIIKKIFEAAKRNTKRGRKITEDVGARGGTKKKYVPLPNWIRSVDIGDVVKGE